MGQSRTVSFRKFMLMKEDFSGSTPPAVASHPSRISTRQITGKKPYNDPKSHDLNVDLDAAKLHQPSFKKNVEQQTKYGILRPQDVSKSSDTTAENLVEHYKRNLLYLHDKMPENIRERSKKWYDGANAIAHGAAEKHGIHPASAAGVYAALSPQKDWFENVALGDRVMDIHHTKQDHPWTPEMESKAAEIYKDPAKKRIHDAIRGKTYGQVSATGNDVHAAAWIRAHSEAHDSPHFPIVSPEGGRGDVKKNADGVTPSKIRWQGLGPIAKAIGAIKAGGDTAKISGLMGEKHKVRSFYNNIIDPNGHHGDVTIDTHAVAAAHMKPFSAASLEVAHNFKTSVAAADTKKGHTGSSGNNNNGVQGHYPIYAEAYKRAAAERGIKPREMQSITWEGVRGLFSASSKRNKGNDEATADKSLVAKTHKVWHDYTQGKHSAEEARDKIHTLAGGMSTPAWHKGD